MAAGDEILIAEADEAYRGSLKKLLEGRGHAVTAVPSAADAREHAQTKVFDVALVDLDLDQPSAGLDVVRFVHEHSPRTGIVLLTGRRSFEGAVEAFRAGCIDVVLKTPEQESSLLRQVDRLLERKRMTSAGGDTELLGEIKGVLDLAFRTMLAMARHVYHDVSVGAMASYRPRVLFVEGEQQLVVELAGLLREKSWELDAAISGGDGLDKSSTHTFDLVVVRDEQPDLPGSMVLRTIQSRNPETLGLLYTTPGREGRIERILHGHTEHITRPFSSAAQLVEECDAMVGRLATTQRDRRVIQAFRADNEDFFRRYAELKLRIDRMLS